MSTVAARLSNVTKAFSRTAQHAGSLKETMLSALRQRSQRDLVLALNNVSLQVHAGEAVGIIGPNGAGKSTLLKLLAGITEPTAGDVETHGRVLGLIELGAGFHPDLNGEENIRLQGALYGLEKASLERSLDQILSFAGLNEFRHLPVRHYSSGMFARLGFAIAVHAEPDLLLVDETLAVGDLEFQERCLREIARLRARGTALLLVTHFPEQTERLCDRLIWLEAGQIRAQGTPGEVLAQWQADLLHRRHAESQGVHSEQIVALGVPGRFGNGKARIESVRFVDAASKARTTFRRGEPMRIEIDYTADASITEVDCALPLATEEGVIVSYNRAAHAGQINRPVDGGGHFSIEYPALDLLPGRYNISFALSDPADIYKHYDVLYKLLYFTVSPEPQWPTVGAVSLNTHVV